MYVLQRLADARKLLGFSFAELSRIYRSSPIVRFTIIGVFIVNLVFVALHVIVKISGELGYYSNTAFFLSVDRSYPELFGYSLSALCAAFLFTSFLYSREAVYLALSIVFVFIALDDGLRLHEEVGSYIVSEFALPALPRLRPQDTGELIVWGTIGGLLLSITLLGFWSSSREAIGFGAVIALTLALLLFFAVGIDMLHVAIKTDSSYVSNMFTIAEDGGEMLALGLAFAFSLLLLLKQLR